MLFILFIPSFSTFSWSYWVLCQRSGRRLTKKYFGKGNFSLYRQKGAMPDTQKNGFLPAVLYCIFEVAKSAQVDAAGVFCKQSNYRVMAHFSLTTVFSSAWLCQQSYSRGAGVRRRSLARPLTRISQKALSGSKPNFMRSYLCAISPDRFFFHFS